MKLTTHATRQAQRRGIASDWMHYALQYGDEFSGGGGCLLYRISAKELRFIQSENPHAWKCGRDHRKVTLVVAGDVVVTAMHRVKPLSKENLPDQFNRHKEINMNAKFVEKSYMTKSTKTNPEKREITQLVPVFDWDKFKLLPNAPEFVEKLFDQCITKMMREIDDDKNGTRPEHMASMESVIAREIGYSESAIRRWCESRDWASSGINPQQITNITEHLVKFAPRKRGVQAEYSLAPEVMAKLAERVTQVVDEDDPAAEWLFTRLTSSKKEELHLMI